MIIKRNISINYSTVLRKNSNMNKDYWAILNPDIFTCLWEGAIGRIRSCPLSFYYGIPVSYFIFNIFRNLKIDIIDNLTYSTSDTFSNFSAELEFEIIRQREFPTVHSRFNSFYLFKDETSLDRAIIKWYPAKDWDFIRGNKVSCKFIFGNLSHPLDSNFIYFYQEKFKTDNFLSENKINWIRSYWKGEQLNRRKTIWEILAKGCCKIETNPVKELYRSLIFKEFPNSKKLLEITAELFEKHPLIFSQYGLATNSLREEKINDKIISVQGLNLIGTRLPLKKMLPKQELSFLNEGVKAEFTDDLKLPDFSNYNFSFGLPSELWSNIFLILKNISNQQDPTIFI